MTARQHSIQADKETLYFNRERVKEEATIGLFNLMEELGVSRADLARRIGRRPSFVSKVLGGSHNLTLETLADLYLALGRAIHFSHSIDLQRVRVPTDIDATINYSMQLGEIYDRRNLETQGVTARTQSGTTTYDLASWDSPSVVRLHGSVCPTSRWTSHAPSLRA